MNLLFYTKFSYHADVLSNVDWTALFIALLIVIVAISAGLYCSSRSSSRKFNKLCNQIGNASGLLLIIFSATMTNSGNSDSKIWSRGWGFYIAVMLPCLGGLLISSAVATLLNLQRPERVTVSVEACYQNVGIATSLALTMFDGQDLNEAMGVPFFYGVVEAVLVGIYCIMCWKLSWTKAPADIPLWQAIFTSYEVLQCEQRDLNAIEVNISESTEATKETQDGSTLFTYFNMDLLGGSSRPFSSKV